MPAISFLNSGLQLSSVGNSLNTGQISISDKSGFFPLYNGADTSGTSGLLAAQTSGASTLQSQSGLATGGVYLTLNPSAGPANTVLTLIKGEALTLSIEYNAQNQCRFDLTPVGSSAVAMTSPWVAVGSEHSVGVSYDTTSGFTTLSVDGTSLTNQLSYLVTGTTQLVASKVFGSNVAGASGQGANGNVTTTPTYNGYLDQLAIFNTAPTAAVLNGMTTDPVGTNAALAGHIETVSNTSASVYSAFSNSVFPNSVNSTTISATNAPAGIQIGDIVSDVRTTNGTQAVVFSGASVTGVTTTVDATGVATVQVTLNSSNTVYSGDVITFTHPLSAAATTTAALTANANTVAISAATGIQAGDFVTGFNIPTNTTVTAISAAQITLSSSIGNNVVNGNESLTFTHPLQGNIVTPNTITPGSGGNGQPVLAVNSAQGIQVGDVAVMSGFIPSYDHVRSINGLNVTLENNISTTIAANSGNVTFVHSTYATAGVNAFAQGDSTLNVTAYSGTIQVGDIVVDDTAGFTGALVNTTVLGYNPNTNIVTLSTPAAANGTGTQTLTFTHTSSNSTTGSALGGSSVISVASGNGIQIGDILVDTTNPLINGTSTNNGITVSNFNGNSVTLSNATPAGRTMAGDSLTFVHPPSATSSVPATTSTVPPATAGTTNTIQGYQNSIGLNTLLYLNNTQGIQSGDFVTGPNIPAGDTVQSIQTTGTGANIKTTGVVLAQATNILVTNPSAFTFTHTTNPDVQIIALYTSATNSAPAAYVAGDSITITANVTANTTASYTYTVQSSDVSSTSPSTTLTNIAKSIVSASPVLGAFTLINGPANGTIELVPQTNSAQVLPLAVVTNSDSKGINENTIQSFYNFASTRTNASVATQTNASADGSVLFNTAALATNLDSSGTVNVNAATVNYGTTVSTSATPVAHGPVFTELASLNGTTATYNIFVDPSYVSGMQLNNVGMTFNVPTSEGTISNIIPSATGTISQVNNTGNGAVSYQWAANQPVTNFTAPIGQMTVNLNTLSVNSFSATVTNLSVNSTNFKDPVQNIPMLLNNPMNSQVYTVTGTIFDQFNPAGQYGLTNAGTPWGQFNTQAALPTTDMFYTVTGAPTANFTFAVQQSNLTPVTPTSQNALVNLNLVANSMPTTASALPFSVILNVPSNATGVTFTPGAGVTLTTPTSTVGHTMTVTGTYSTGKGVVGSSTPVLGTLSTILTNEFNNGGQFSMDTASLNGNAATGQSLYFGMAETNQSGQYSISNLPAGTLNIKPFNNAAQMNPGNMTVNDVLAVMSIAAGKGVPGGLGQAIGQASNLLPTDFVAADFNQDGQVTGADALNLLNFIVAVAKPAAPGFVYMNAMSNSLINTPETSTNVVIPAIGSVQTNLSLSNSVLLTGDSSKVVNIIGVQPGNVVNF